MTSQTKTPAPVISPRADVKTKRDCIPAFYYYPDTARLRTPIRDAGLEIIYQAAREVDDGRLKYGDVTLRAPFMDDDRETLALTPCGGYQRLGRHLRVDARSYRRNH